MKTKLALLCALAAMPLVSCGTGNSSQSGSAYSSGSGSATNGRPSQSTGSDQSKDPAQPTSLEIAFGDYCNDGDTLAEVDFDGISFLFDVGTGSNAPIYYANGASARMYAGNTLTVTAANITKIEFGITDTQKKGTVTASVGTFANDVWTGDAESVTFTVTEKQYRISSVKVDFTPGDIVGPGGGLEFDTAAEGVVAFYAARGVTVDKAPGISAIPDTAVLSTEYVVEPTMFEYPYFSLLLEAGYGDTVLDALEAEGFTVPQTPTEYGFECTTDTLEVDVLVLSEADLEDFPDYEVGQVVVTYYVLADFAEAGGELDFETVQEGVVAFYAAFDITVTKAPGISTIQDSDVLYVDYNLDETSDDPYFCIGVAGSFLDTVLAELKTDGYDVPAQPTEGIYVIEKGDVYIEVCVLDADYASFYEVPEGSLDICFWLA